MSIGGDWEESKDNLTKFHEGPEIFSGGCGEFIISTCISLRPQFAEAAVQSFDQFNNYYSGCLALEQAT